MHIKQIPFPGKIYGWHTLPGERTRKNRLEGIRSRTQMGYRAQVFKAVALLLKRIIRREAPSTRTSLSLHFDRLLCPGCLYNCTRPPPQQLHADSGCFRKSRHFTAVYDPKRLKKVPSLTTRESKVLGIPVASHPSANGDLPALILFFSLNKSLMFVSSIFLPLVFGVLNKR